MSADWEDKAGTAATNFSLTGTAAPSTVPLLPADASSLPPAGAAAEPARLAQLEASVLQTQGSVEELRRELCGKMDVIEALDSKLDVLSRRVGASLDSIMAELRMLRAEHGERETAERLKPSIPAPVDTSDTATAHSEAHSEAHLEAHLEAHSEAQERVKPRKMSGRLSERAARTSSGL